MGGHHAPLVSQFFFLVRQSPLPRDGSSRDLPITFLLGISLRRSPDWPYSTPRHWPFAYRRTRSHIARRICLHGHSRPHTAKHHQPHGITYNSRDPLRAASSLNSFTGAVSPVIGTPLLFCTTQNAPNDIAAGTPYFLAAFLVAAALLLSQRLGIGKAIKDN